MTGGLTSGRRQNVPSHLPTGTFHLQLTCRTQLLIRVQDRFASFAATTEIRCSIANKVDRHSFIHPSSQLWLLAMDTNISLKLVTIISKCCQQKNEPRKMRLLVVPAAIGRRTYCPCYIGLLAKTKMALLWSRTFFYPIVGHSSFLIKRNGQRWMCVQITK